MEDIPYVPMSSWRISHSVEGSPAIFFQGQDHAGGTPGLHARAAGTILPFAAARQTGILHDFSICVCTV